ncbi:hypothetical protein [Vibrio algarum]|uniref:Holin n=1 Tax=Vibrio algarum TaxID=3020714 RepID=A0ABT4YMR8_9VIBR|nr:hypothetical protein [Vibrio sp. KJ40-1]MDB1122842.1 hypothetical protein [Vibrio sp. KJ40-1]
MNKFFKKIGLDLSQPSTKKGLVLVASGAALATGHPELISASVTGSGVQIGGLIGATVPLLIGIYEALRNELKHD